MEPNTLRKQWVQGQMVRVDDLGGVAFTGEANAHTFLISGIDQDGSEVPISGTITGKVLNAAHTQVPLSGSVSDGVASITMSQDCYAVPGRFVLSVFATTGDATACIYCGVGTINNTGSGAVVYPTTGLPDLVQLVAQVQEVIGSIPADYSALVSRVDDLKSALSVENIINNPGVWEQGNIDGQGADAESVSRVRTGFIDASDFDLLTYSINATYRFYIVLYNSSKVKTASYGWITNTSGSQDISSAAYVRLLFTRLGDTLTPYATTDDAETYLNTWFYGFTASSIKQNMDLTNTINIRTQRQDAAFTDLNDAKQPGWYTMSYNGEYAHSPDGLGTGRRSLRVVSKSANTAYVLQILVNATTGIIYTRTYYNNTTWDDWVTSYKEPSVKNVIFHSLLNPAWHRYIYAKGKMWEEYWNTEEAYTKAGQDGRCWGINGDVQYTSDNALVMWHDTTISYNGNDVAVRSITLEQIQSISIAYNGKTYSVPTFDEYLAICRKYGKVCNPELKGPTAGWSWVTNGKSSLIDAIIQKIKNAGIQDSCFIDAGNTDLNYIKAQHPGIMTCRLWDANVTEENIESLLDDPNVIQAGYPANWDSYDTMKIAHNAGQKTLTYSARSSSASTNIANLTAMKATNADIIAVFIDPDSDE